MSTAIIVAVVAFVSTIVGATIGAATNYVLAVRRERAGRERDDRNHAIEVKRAARLIERELLRASAAATICVEKKHWWAKDVHLTTKAWQKYGGVIAAELSDEAWGKVIVAFEAVDNISGARDLAVALSVDNNPISDVAGLIPMLRDIMSGRVALAPFVYSGQAERVQPPPHSGG